MIDPETGQPMTAEQVEEIHGTDAYKSYLPAAQADLRVSTLQSQAENYQRSADANVEKAQELAMQAAEQGISLNRYVTDKLCA